MAGRVWLTKNYMKPTGLLTSYDSFSLWRDCVGKGKRSETLSGKVYDRSEGNIVNTTKLAGTNPRALAAAWSKLLRKVVLDKKQLLGTKQLGGWCQMQKRTLVNASLV